MSAQTETLVISSNRNPLEVEALRAIYGGGATFRIATSAKELVAIILSFVQIKRLVIATHGSEGDIIIGGVHTSISKLAEQLQISTSKPKVTESIVFDGCNVAGESTSLSQFMVALSAPRLRAFAVTRLWWHDDYLFPKGVDPKTLEPVKRRYEFYKIYLVEGQPTFDAMVKRGGKVRVWYEGFSRVRRERPQTETEKRDVQPRSALVRIRTASKDTASLKSSTSRPGGPLVEVELFSP